MTTAPAGEKVTQSKDKGCSQNEGSDEYEGECQPNSSRQIILILCLMMNYLYDFVNENCIVNIKRKPHILAMQKLMYTYIT